MMKKENEEQIKQKLQNIQHHFQQLQSAFHYDSQILRSEYQNRIANEDSNTAQIEYQQRVQSLNYNYSRNKDQLQTMFDSICMQNAMNSCADVPVYIPQSQTMDV